MQDQNRTWSGGDNVCPPAALSPDETNHSRQICTSSSDFALLSSADFFSTYIDISAGYHLELNGARYHRIDTGAVPAGCVEVNVLIDDNGREFKSVMVAGQVGMRARSSGDKSLVPDGWRDTVSPVAGWWIFTKKGDVH